MCTPRTRHTMLYLHPMSSVLCAADFFQDTRNSLWRQKYGEHHVCFSELNLSAIYFNASVYLNKWPISLLMASCKKAGFSVKILECDIVSLVKMNYKDRKDSGS